MILYFAFGSGAYILTLQLISHTQTGIMVAVWHTVRGIVVLGQLDMLDVVAGLHEIDTPLEVDKVSYIMCCYR